MSADSGRQTAARAMLSPVADDRLPTGCRRIDRAGYGQDRMAYFKTAAGGPPSAVCGTGQLRAPHGGPGPMCYKFETLEVWQRSLEYADQIHEIADALPKHERYNLADQTTRATNGIPTGVG